MKKILLSLALLVLALNVNAQYKVGDIYNENGVKGMVVIVTDGGMHGLVISMTSYNKKWLDDKGVKFDTEAFFEDDGMKNMEAIEKYIEANNKSWADFPIFEWARSLGDGWYIPAKDELMEIGKSLCGGSTKYNHKMVKNYSKLLKKAKGDSLIDDGFGGTKALRRMYSSTEAEGGAVYSLCLKLSAGAILIGGNPRGNIEMIPMNKSHSGGKFGGAGSRAVHKF